MIAKTDDPSAAFERAVSEFARSTSSLQFYTDFFGSRVFRIGNGPDVPVLDEEEQEFSKLCIFKIMVSPSEIQKDPKLYEEMTALEVKWSDRVEWQHDDKGFRAKFKNHVLAKDFTEIVEFTDHFRDSLSLAIRSTVIALVGSIEILIADLLRTIFLMHDGKIAGEEKVLSMKDLLEIGSIDEARRHLIENKIEGVLYGDVNRWVTSLLQAADVDKEQVAAELPQIIEICQTRNLIIHNNGVIGRRYFANVDERSRRGNIGEKIPFDRKYLNESIEKVDTFFLAVAYLVWKKQLRDDLTRPSVFHSVAYERIRRGRYRVAERLAGLVESDRRADEDARSSAKVNRWQAKKWAGEFEDVKSEVKEWDTSALQTKYVLAKAVLLDETDEAIDILKNLLAAGDLGSMEVMEWPLFRNIRGLERFIQEVEPLLDEDVRRRLQRVRRRLREKE